LSVKEILISPFRGKSGRDGILGFLGERAADKIRVELGEVRNKGMQEAIRARQPGGMFREVEPDYSREIRMPDAPSPSTEIWVAAIRLAILALRVPGLEPLIGTPDGTGEPCT
jgi:hypothetical protein